MKYLKNYKVHILDKSLVAKLCNIKLNEEDLGILLSLSGWNYGFIMQRGELFGSGMRISDKQVSLLAKMVSEEDFHQISKRDLEIAGKTIGYEQNKFQHDLYNQMKKLSFSIYSNGKN